MKHLFDISNQKSNKPDNKYTVKCEVPQYLPKDTKPDIRALVDNSKYLELVQEIKSSNVTNEEKHFLLQAATRHYVFNYSLIADYYAHSNSEMQSLMEKSALVIIDINDAIANGYVQLSSTLKSIMEESGETTK